MLDTKAEDIMTKDVVTVQSHVSADELLDLMTRHHHMGYPVVSENGMLMGIVTFENFMKVPKERRNEVTVGQIAKKKLVTAYPEDSVFEAFGKMNEHEIGRLLIVDKKDCRKLRGILTRTDIMQLLGRNI